MTRRLVLASAFAVVMTAAFLPGSGVGSTAAAARGERAVPARLAAAIHARFGAGAIRRSSAASSVPDGPSLGFTVALSADGTTALVGAYGVAHDKGAAYIFHASDAGSWASTDTPTAALMNKPGPANNQLFGYTVALSSDGTTAFVGAPLVGTGLSGVGAIYVFHASAEDAWASVTTPAMTLKIPDAIFLGISLAVSSDGTTLAAGAPFRDTFAGGGYIFHAASEDTWGSTSSLSGTLSNSLESRDDGGVGFRVAIAGDGLTALLSDSQNTATGGGGYLYHVAAEDAWATTTTPTAILTNVNSSQYDNLGNDVALSSDGTVALLGAPGAAAADVFRIADASTWATTSTPTATLSNGLAGGFGYSVILSSDGTTALVAAPGHGNARGAASLFRVADEASWVSSSTPTAALSDSGSHPGDVLGLAAALSGDATTALLGAPGVRFDTGATDVYHVADANSWASRSAGAATSTSTPTAILTDSALDQCVVPKLKGLKVRSAKSALKTRSCQLGKVTRVVSKGKRGHVVSQSKKIGARLPLGAKIAVKVVK